MKNLVAILIMSGLAWPAVASAAVTDFSVLEPMVVQEGGRQKPYFVFAEESLLAMSGRTGIETGDGRMDAMGVVTRMWFEPEEWIETPMLLVDHRPLKIEAGLDASRKHFSYQELARSEGLRALLVEAAAERSRDPSERLQGLLKEAADVGMRLAVFEGLANGSLFRVVPRAGGGAWRILPDGQPEFDAMRTAFFGGEQEAFDRAAQGLMRHLEEIAPGDRLSERLVALEIFYQKLHPFRWAWILYLASGIVLGVTWMKGRRFGYSAAWTLAVAGLGFQIFGFVCRVLISGRAPVTNMYESVIWVAFGTILFALVFEALNRSRFYLLGAIPVAVVSLILADTQPVALDPSITPLVPVLQSNFWLTTHVLTITLSYAAFALALGVAHIALGMVIAGRKPAQELYTYVYRALQVGVLLLASGTILGGVWANYSWGRFWDWDPKETWALVALLAYLFVLHGRVAGKWAGFGISVGAILAFQTIIMAWYGVNFVLGTGLHSYGFGTGGLPMAIGFVGFELLFTGVAIWRHVAGGKSAKPAPSKQVGTPITP